MARYDSRTTTFSPQGRLFQVEYAMTAIQNAGACVGIKAKDAIVLATERKDISKLLVKTKNSDKLYRLEEHVVCAVAGLTSDANVLVSYLRRSAQAYRQSFQEPQPIDQLIRRVCDLKQGYTQYGGQRPFGVSFLYAGYDYANGLQLYHSDPSGNFACWNARAIGRHEPEANQVLKEDYKGSSDEMTVEQAKKMAVKCFRKILDVNDDLELKMDLVVISKHEAKELVVQENASEEEIEAISKTLAAEELEKASS